MAKLTPCQTRALVAIEDLKNNKILDSVDGLGSKNLIAANTILITGAAGTGKTYMLQHLQDYIDPTKVVATTLTSKAIMQIKKASAYTNLKVVNIYDFLGLVLKKVDGIATTELLEPKRYFKPDDTIECVVVDEAQMVSETLFQHIVLDIIENGRKYAFLADICQIPPVSHIKSDLSPIYTSSPHVVNMTTNVRQKPDNPLSSLLLQMRESMTTVSSTNLSNDAINVELTKSNIKNGMGYAALDKAGFRKLYPFVFKNVERLHDGYAKILCWSPDSVARHNDEVRKALGFDTSLPFNVGGLAAFNTAYYERDKLIIPTGTEVIVRAVNLKTNVQIAYYEIVTDSVYGRTHFKMLVQTSKNLVRYHNALSNLAKKAVKNRNYIAFNSYKNQFVELIPTYATTVHKAQGATYNTVLIDCFDIYNRPDKNNARHILYVAATRATDKALFCWDNWDN